MKSKRKLSALLATIGTVVGLAAVTVAPAQAATGPGEDREIVSPTSWWTYTGLTQAQVSTTLTNNHARLTDLKVTNPTTSPRYTVTEVANTGAYASGWYWYLGLTPAQVVSTATAHHARPTVVQCFKSGTAVKCDTIMIVNTGANAEAWSFYYGTTSFLASKVNAAKNRMVSFGRIQGTSDYTAVFGANTGTDHMGWWWYYGLTAAQVVSKSTANHARIVDVDENTSNGTFDTLMYANPAKTPYYFYISSSLASLATKALQLGQRIFDVTPYQSGRTTEYAAVMVNNLNAASLAAASLIAPKVKGGNYGFEFKPVGGATLASLQPSTPFEPASSIKVLFHYTSIVKEQAGTTNDGTTITYRYNPSDPTNSGICPDSYNTTTTTNLANADAQMMENSDNRMTLGIETKYTKATMLAEATHLGLTATKLNHDIGCPTATTHNATSLNDLDKIYEAFETSKDITSPTWRTQFVSRMLNQANYPGYKTSICPTVNTIAAQLGKSQATATAFCNAITWIAKGGSYQYAAALPAKVSYSNGSVTGLPYKSGGKTTIKQFFYGDYFDEDTLTSTAAGTALSNARNAAYLSVLKPYIKAALATW